MRLPPKATIRPAASGRRCLRCQAGEKATYRRNLGRQDGHAPKPAPPTRFVIGGFTPSLKNLDTLIFDYYEGNRLIYVARTRNGSRPKSREELFRKIRSLEVGACPFANLPDAKSGRWVQGLTAAKMRECRWVKPMRVGQFEFVEWTPDNHLRDSRFLGLREHKNPNDVKREP